jgi:radial spoke head protein 4A
MASFEEAKQFLKKDANGSNLYDHLAETLLKVLVEKPANSFDAFEDISAGVKQAAFVADASASAGNASAAAAAAQLEWANAVAALTSPAGEDEAMPEPTEGMQDLVAEGAMLEAAGAGFGREETQRLQAALIKLGSDSGATNLRIWGKISGTGADYIVAEGEAAEDDAEEPSADLEGKDGANKYAYWVCAWAGAAWSKLPSVKASQILCASKIKKMLTGNLEAPVTGYPPFPGNEANLLRAQIARISAESVLVPSGLYDAEDEESPGALTLKEEPEPADDLSDLGSWCHFQQSLDATSGRTKKWEDPDAGEDDAPEEEVEFNVRGPLAACADDEGEPWAARAAGKLSVVRSMAWPGAVSVGLGAKFVNLYVGYGTAWNAAAYEPQLPPAQRTEYAITEETAEEDTTARLIEAEDIITEPAKPEEEEEDE